MSDEVELIMATKIGFTQTGRALRIDTPLGEDVLLLRAVAFREVHDIGYHDCCVHHCAILPEQLSPALPRRPLREATRPVPFLPSKLLARG